MKIALGIELPFCDKIFDFITAPLPSRHLQVKYHLSCKQLENLEKIDIIFIPALKTEMMYNACDQLDHLRLSNNKVVREAYVIVVDDEVNSLELDDHLNLHLDYRVEVKKSKQIDDSFQINPDTKQKRIDYIINNIGNEKSFTGRHDAANKWGPYKLIQGYQLLSGRPQPEMEAIKDNLSEDLYFKKKLLGDQNILNSDHFSQNKVDSFRSALCKSRKILVVDDELNQGWQLVYTAIFKQANSKIEIDYVGDFATASKKNAKDYDLILLDLRMNQAASEDASDIENIHQTSGIELLHIYKENCLWTPVIITTASNKVWSHKAALDEGADGFWSKQGVDYEGTINFSVDNAENLLTIIWHALEWSQEIGKIIAQYYDISDIFEYNYKNIHLSYRIREKARIFAAVLCRKNSKLIEKLSDHLQPKLAYLIAYSIINQIRELFLEDKKRSFALRYVEGYSTFCNFQEGNKVALNVEVANVLLSKNSIFGANINKSEIDSLLIEFLLIKYSIHNRGKFDQLRKKRNCLPFIHDKEEKGTDFEVERKDIEDILSLYHDILLGVK